MSQQPRPTFDAVTIEPGRIREEANRIAGELGDATPAAGVRLDLGAVHYVASEDLGALVLLNKKLRESGGRLSLVNVRPTVSALLAITRLDTIIDVQKV
jgi:anti-anti-sigma factor